LLERSNMYLSFECSDVDPGILVGVGSRFPEGLDPISLKDPVSAQGSRVVHVHFGRIRIRNP